MIDQFSLRRVLVAFSGGPDSTLLLHALSQVKIEIGVAHVDHRWRKESTEQAQDLKKQVEALKVPFYLKTLDLDNTTELACREERYRFFKEICDSEGYQAVFLGHHRDDQAETVLKRLLEGASLGALGGMEKASFLNGMLILRPMLDTSKKEILQMLKTPCIEDQTNLDPKYLRGKFRKKIIPHLNEEFGKSVTEPLVRLGKECSELTEFMKGRFKEELKQKEILDFSFIETRFEIKWLVRAWLKAQNLRPSHAILEDIAKAIEEKRRNKKFIINGVTIAIDNGRINPLPRISCLLKWN